MSEQKILRFITLAPVVFIPSVVAIIFYITFLHNQAVFKNSYANIKENLVQKQKEITASKVKMAIELIEHERSTITKSLREKVKNRVLQAFTIGSSIYARNRGKKSDKEIKEMILQSLRPMIWNEGESFIFILTKNGDFVLAPEYLRHLEGKSMISFKDAASRHVIRDEIELIEDQGEGFLQNTFTRPNKDASKQYRQVSFVKDFEIFEWYLGSAEYLDTTAQEIERSMLCILRNISKNNFDYLFIFDKEGKVILHSYTPELEGKNLFDSGDKLQRSLVEKLQENRTKDYANFISYKWENPKTKKIDTKFSYIQNIPNSDWIIGSGFYMSQIDETSNKKQTELIDINEKKLMWILIYSCLLGTVSIVISFLISKKLKEKFKALKSSLEQKSSELKKLNEDLEHKIEQRTKELKEAYEKMQLIANTDSLTQIHNRYSFLKAFNKELEKYKISRIKFSLIMFDIDHFKNINDTYGHNVGDEVIIKIAHIVQECLRHSDVFGRVGGEEFMILLPYTPVDSAKEIAERIRQKISSYIFDKAKNVTVSLGAVEYIDGENAHEMLKRVDIALYRAKESGRDTTSVS